MHENALHGRVFPCLFMQSKNQISNKNLKFGMAVKYRFIKLVITFIAQSLLLYTLNKFGWLEGGDTGNPQALTEVCDGGERGKPTLMQLEV